MYNHIVLQGLSCWKFSFIHTINVKMMDARVKETPSSFFLSACLHWLWRPPGVISPVDAFPASSIWALVSTWMIEESLLWEFEVFDWKESFENRGCDDSLSRFTDGLSWLMTESHSILNSSRQQKNLSISILIWFISSTEYDYLPKAMTYDQSSCNAWMVSFQYQQKISEPFFLRGVQILVEFILDSNIRIQNFL